MQELIEKGRRAKAAAAETALLSTAVKDAALRSIAGALRGRANEILDANREDLRAAEQNGMSAVLADRLRLTEQRIADMAEGVCQIAALPDPVGEGVSRTVRPNGLIIDKVRVPLGVVGIIYEARPNVTADAAALCIKAGNAVILRGGKEAFRSNRAIVKIMCDAAGKAGLPDGTVQLIEDTSRESATALMRLNEYLDVIIPRGGAGLIRAVVENATVPAIETGTGNCHVYVERSADFDMARKIVMNAKTSRVSVCNAEEKLLIDREIAAEFLPDMLRELDAAGVEIRGDEEVCRLFPQASAATEEDWGTEYLDYIIGVRTVSGPDEAIAHINRYGSGHSEAIVTNDFACAQSFLDRVDAAAVYVNASTRFTDGFEFGFGAEMGISTQKLHARGPMGLRELTTTKFRITGSGQIR